MKNPNAIRRILMTVAALVAVGAVSFGATGCTSASASAPTAVTQAAPAAAAPTAATPAAAAPSPTTAAASGPTAATGQKVVQSSCIGRCHQSNLLGKRFPASRAQAIAADMGPKAGLTSDQKAAVVAYFAQ